MIADGKTEVLVPVVPELDLACWEDPETIQISLIADPAYQIYDQTTATINLWDRPQAGMVISGGGATSEIGPEVVLSVARSCGYQQYPSSEWRDEQVYLFIFGSAVPTFGTPINGFTDYTISGVDWLSGPVVSKWGCYPKPPMCSGESFAMAQVTVRANEVYKTVTITPYNDSYQEYLEDIKIGTWDCPSVFYTISDNDSLIKGWPSMILVPLKNAILVKWETVSGFDKYVIKKSTLPTGPFTTVATVQFPANTSPSFLDTSVVDGTTYYYQVVTVNSQGQEGPAQPYTAGGTPLVVPSVSVSAPVDLAIEGGQNGSFRLSRSGTTSGALDVLYRLGGTATPVADYTDIGRSATILNGNTFADKTVTALSDALTESECVELTVVPNPAASYEIATASAVIAVRDAGVGCYGPTIIRQPTDQSVLRGSTATFTAVANGTGLNYQWRIGDSDIGGATSPTLTINNADFSNQAKYHVFITGNCGSATSAEASLQVRETGQLDLSFTNSASFGANNAVTGHGVQLDGKIVICGAFTQVNGVARANIARLNSDGSLDTTFTPSFNGAIHAMVIQPDGKIVVVGDFSQVNGVSHTTIVRLNSDGSIDSGSPTGPLNGPSGLTIRDVALQTDGKIVAVGWSNGNGLGWVGRYGIDGTMLDGGDTTPDYVTRCVAVQPDGKILIGGDFNSVNDGTVYTRHGIARLNSNFLVDEEFSPNVSGGVFDIVVQPDGKILLAGAFSAVNTIARNGIARLGSDGSLDTFNPGCAGVQTLVCRPDGRIYIGGNFTQVNGSSRNGIARLNSDGSLDLGFNPGSGLANPGLASTIGLLPNSKIFVGGWFGTYNGVTRTNLARVLAE